MAELKILIIEDEPAQIQVYDDVISQHNKKHDLKIVPTICKNFKDGKEALATPDYDAAIIDLKLSNSKELEGRILVEAVYQKIRIPVIVYSGSIAQIDDIKENALLKKKLRTEQLSDILNEIIGIYNTGITKLLRPSGVIDTKLTEIFWSHLSENLDVWIKHNNPDTLLRYVLSHFLEYLDINPLGDFEEYHSTEIYIIPPIKKNIHTGDLIKLDGGYYLVMTPACDIIYNYKMNDKNEKIQYRRADKMALAKVDDFNYKSMCLNKRNELDKSKISDFVTNQSYRYHYLPPFINDNGFLIDFQNLVSVSFDSKFERIATISSPFIKDIISRFSNYYSRQGQPTFNQGSLIDELYARK